MTNNDKLPVPTSEGKTVPLPENKATGPINPRAMGLYNLHDPKDRPHSRPHAGAIPSWARKDPANNGDRNGSFGPTPRPDNSFPEWFDDTESDKILELTGGSFDANGRFRKEVNGRPSQWKLPQSHKERTEAQDRRTANSPHEPNNTPSEKSLEKVEFYYLDPSNILQGPFSKSQMYTWYEMHYFNDNLKVRRSTDFEFKTLDELKKLNGEKLFDFKPLELPKKFRYSPIIPPTGLPDLINPKLGGLFGGTTWNDTLTQSQTPPLNKTAATTAFEENSQQLERQRYDLKKKQEELAAQQRKLEEQTKQLNIETQKKEVFLQKQFHDELLKKEMQNLELQRKIETMAAMNQALLEAERIRAEEKLKAAEEHRKKMEERKIAEDKRIAEENKRRQEEERFSYNSRRAEEAAEEHRKMLAKKAEEDSAIIRKKQQAEAANRQEVRQAYRDTEIMVTNENVWNKPAVKEDQWQTVAKKAPQQKPKAPAWSNGEQSPGQTGKTLREIQDEESQQEAKEIAKIRKEEEKQRANSLPIGSWPNANRTQQWVAGTVTKTPTKPAWGGAASNPRPVAKSALNWDGPTLQAANRSPPAIAANKKSPPKTAQKIQAKSLVEESFKRWFEKRLHGLAGSQIDATVLIEFLDGVGSPNEVEDYIQEYAGDSKAAKDFTKEYLQRRSESRQRNKAEKDDLSSASKAGSPTAANIGKKKKNKATRLIVDSAHLGFRAISDPNRVNQGEIDTVVYPSKQRN